MEMKKNPWRVDVQPIDPSETEKYSLYGEYTRNQKQGFIEMIKLVDKYIRDLQDAGELTGYVRINARIKSAESAFINDAIDNKALDDVFGLEVLAGNERALEKIINKLKNYTNALMEKKHDKANGYKATHQVVEIKREVFDELGFEDMDYDEFPMVEFQFKTFEVKENSTSGPANHADYKGQVREEVQAMYDRGELNENNLPTMYIVENHRIRVLDKEETIRELYPFVRIHREREEGEESR